VHSVLAQARRGTIVRHAARRQLDRQVAPGLQALDRRDNDPRGTGIGSLFVPQIKFTPPATRKPRGVVTFGPDDFVTGL
jgi:hypothetical protein